MGVEFRELTGKLRTLETDNRKLQAGVVELTGKVAMSKVGTSFSAQYEQEYYMLEQRLTELQEQLRQKRVETVVQKKPTGPLVETESVEVVDSANVAELEATLRMLLTEQ